MTVQLIMWESGTRMFNIQAHPCYYNFVNQISFIKWQTSSDQDRTNMLNQMLMPYNGRVIKFSVMQHIVFEFDHEEDLTQFVLTWS